MVESGDQAAQLAYDVFIHRLRKYIGAYLAVLRHTDVITFTAGIGENAPGCVGTPWPVWVSSASPGRGAQS